MQRVLRGTQATITVTWFDAEGSAVPAPAATVDITRANGTVLVTAGATVAVGNTSTYTLTQTTLLDELTVTWTSVSGSRETKVEIVGGYYFSVNDARATDKSLEDPARYPASEIIAVRQEVEEEFERICAVSFVPRFRRAEVRGRLLPDSLIRSIRSVTVNGTAYTTEELAAVPFSAGILHQTLTAVVEYEHGWDSPPAEIRRAAITRLRSRLNAAKSAIPDRATSFSVAEGGSYRLDTPGEHKTGLPEVDAVLARYHHRYPAIA